MFLALLISSTIFLVTVDALGSIYEKGENDRIARLDDFKEAGFEDTVDTSLNEESPETRLDDRDAAIPSLQKARCPINKNFYTVNNLNNKVRVLKSALNAQHSAIRVVEPKVTKRQSVKTLIKLAKKIIEKLKNGHYKRLSGE